MRNTPELFLFCIAANMLANVGKWDDSCLPPTEPPSNDGFLGVVPRTVNGTGHTGPSRFFATSP